jgi:hypothetical protein
VCDHVFTFVVHDFSRSALLQGMFVVRKNQTTQKEHGPPLKRQKTSGWKDYSKPFLNDRSAEDKAAADKAAAEKAVADKEAEDAEIAAAWKWGEEQQAAEEAAAAKEEADRQARLAAMGAAAKHGVRAN